MSKLNRREFKELLTEWNKLIEDDKLDKNNKPISEAVDIVSMLSDIGSQIAQYSPEIIGSLGSVAAGIGVSKIKSSLEERNKKKKIAELSILFIERFISEINEDINNDLKSSEAKEKYREGLEILNQVKSLSFNDKRYFISLSRDTNWDHKSWFAPKVSSSKKHEELLAMKNKLFEINNYFINGNMHFVFQENLNENIEEVTNNADVIKQKMIDIIKRNSFVDDEYWLQKIRLEVLEDIKDTIQNNSNFFKTLIRKNEFKVCRSNSSDKSLGEWSKLYSSSSFLDEYGVKENVSKNIVDLYFNQFKKDYEGGITLFDYAGWGSGKTIAKSQLVFSFNYEKDLRMVQENFESINIEDFCEDMFNFLFFKLIIDEDQSSEVSYTRKAEFQELKEKISNVIPASVVELDYHGNMNIKPQTLDQFKAMSEEDFQKLVGILHSHQVRNKKQSNPIKVSLIRNPTNFRHLQEEDRANTIKLSEALSKEMASQNAVNKIKSILDVFKVLNFSSPALFILSFLNEHGAKPVYKKLVDYLCSIDSDLGEKIRNLLSSNQNQTQKDQSIDDIVDYFTSSTEGGRIVNRVFQIIMATCL